LTVQNRTAVRKPPARHSSEAQYRLLFEKNPHPMWVYDAASLKFLAVNEAAIAHYGYSREEFLAMALTGIRPSDEATRLRDHFNTHATVVHKGPHSVGTWKHRKKDGDIITVEIVSSPIYFNQKPAILALANDITERKVLEEQLRQAQKMEAIGRLAGGVAHDFNNLLGVIAGYSDLLLAKTEPADQFQRGLLQIKKAADRAAALTKQLLAFSRRQIIQPKILDLNDVVVGVESMLRRLIGEDIELKVVCDCQLWCVNVDAGQMEQVLMNLVVNARDAMPQGGSITIEMANIDWRGGKVQHRDVPPGSYVMLAVSDTGCGMDEETRSHVFEPFFTTKEQGKGTGLGLSTVYGIVKQSDGYIWVYSESGVGTTFKIYLAGIKEAQAAIHDEPVSAPAQGRTGTVLVVEDQELFSGMIREVLEERGYKVIIASNGVVALDVCRQNPHTIDLVLTDVVMPKMSGPQMAEQVKALDPAMKVLFMSGYTDDAIVRHGILAQQNEFLQKPFTAATLLQKVQRVLDS